MNASVLVVLVFAFVFALFEAWRGSTTISRTPRRTASATAVACVRRE